MLSVHLATLISYLSSVIKTNMHALLGSVLS